MAHTVYILGAGASEEVGYPLAGGLKIDILKRCTEKAFMDAIGRLGHESATCDLLTKNFRNSARKSIDRFLKDNQQFLPIGKMAIASCLLEQEYPGKVLDSNSWYVDFCDSISGSFDAYPSQDFSIISFNYDRSLEAALQISLTHQYADVSNDKIIEKLNSLTIIHMHGMVAATPWEEGARHYQKYTNIEHNNNVLLEAEKRISIVHENSDRQSKMSNLAQAEIRKADQIIFMGFSFDKDNMAALGFLNARPKRIESNISPETIRSKKSAVIHACTFGMADSEVKSMTAYFGFSENFKPLNKTCREFLKEIGIFSQYND